MDAYALGANLWWCNYSSISLLETDLNDMEPVYLSMDISTDSHCTDNLRWTHRTDLGSPTSSQANPFKFKIVVTELSRIIFIESQK